jgi:UMF1 family MFS transporter
VWSWALYDFANTIFSISILSFFFPVWLATELDAGPDVFNYATAAGALLVVLTAPFLGAVADLRQRRKPFLIVLTLVAVGLTVGLEFVGTVAVAVAVFIAANYAYQSALLFYNALLPGVSVGRGAGRVSGYGVGPNFLCDRWGDGAGVARASRRLAGEWGRAERQCFLAYGGALFGF